MRIAACIFVLLLALGASGAIMVSEMRAAGPAKTPVGADDLSTLSFRPHPGSHLPLATKLIAEDGRPVTLGDYFGKSPVILVLDYLRCTSLCGVTLRNLVSGALRDLPLVPGRDYRLLAISIDPRDKPADAAAARAKYVALLERTDGAAGIHFMTGGQEAVRNIADAVGFPYRYDALLDAYIHPAGFAVASPEGVISRYVEGVAVSPSGLVGALADARQNKSQGLLTRLVLLCHIQGAPLGRFTVPVLSAFMAAELAAGLAALAIFTMVRRRSG